MDRLLEGSLKDCKIRGLNSSSTPHYIYVLRRFSAFLNHRGCPITAGEQGGAEKLY